MHTGLHDHMTHVESPAPLRDMPVVEHRRAELPDELIVDVRTPREFEEAHIPSSRNIPLTDVDQYLSELAEVASTRTIALVCRTQNRASQAYEQLTRHGITNCRILDLGLAQWISEGRPVIRGRQAVSLERQVRIIAGVMTAIGTVLGMMAHSWFLVIPLSVGLGLLHAGATNSCLMGMLLAKLPYNR